MPTNLQYIKNIADYVKNKPVNSKTELNKIRRKWKNKKSRPRSLEGFNFNFKIKLFFIVNKILI